MEHRLINAALRGQARARAGLLHQLSDAWYRAALAWNGDLTQAQDATQAAAIRLARQMSVTLDPNTFELFTWQTLIAILREMDASPATLPILAAARRSGITVLVRPTATDNEPTLSHLRAFFAGMEGPTKAVAIFDILELLPLQAVQSLLPDVNVRSERRSALRIIRDRRNLPDQPSAGGFRQRIAQARGAYHSAKYPGDLRIELFRKKKPNWILPVAIGGMIASLSLVLISVALRPSRTLPGPGKRPASQPTSGITVK